MDIPATGLGQQTYNRLRSDGLERLRSSNRIPLTQTNSAEFSSALQRIQSLEARVPQQAGGAAESRQNAEVERANMLSSTHAVFEEAMSLLSANHPYVGGVPTDNIDARIEAFERRNADDLSADLPNLAANALEAQEILTAMRMVSRSEEELEDWEAVPLNLQREIESRIRSEMQDIEEALEGQSSILRDTTNLRNL